MRWGVTSRYVRPEPSRRLPIRGLVVTADRRRPDGGTHVGTAPSTESPQPAGYASSLDRVLYALFARHADDRRHVQDRKRYRGTDLRLSFDVYLARVYGLSWVVALLVTLPTAVIAAAMGDRLPLPSVGEVLPLASFGLPTSSTTVVVAVAALAVGGLVKAATVRLGGGYLRWLASARRNDIERSPAPSAPSTFSPRGATVTERCSGRWPPPTPTARRRCRSGKC